MACKLETFLNKKLAGGARSEMVGKTRLISSVSQHKNKSRRNVTDLPGVTVIAIFHFRFYHLGYWMLSLKDNF